jgi:hypothetical protein
MLSLNDKFAELRTRIAQGPSLRGYGVEPVYYLVFPCAEIILVKEKTPAWLGELRNSGWDAHELSIGRMVTEHLQQHPLLKAMHVGEKMLLRTKGAQNMDAFLSDLGTSLQELVMPQGKLHPQLAERLEAEVAASNQRPKGLLLFTDIEALHPLLRINVIENHLNGKVKQPIVVLYPGKRHDQTTLRFLEFYPADPNYRSEHIG